MSGGRALRKPLVTFERRDPRADVLVVTNSWPHAGSRVFGIPVKRQIDALVADGLRCDVVFIRGFRTPLAYLVGALAIAWAQLRRPPYRLVHVHGGETLLSGIWYRRAPLLVTYLGSDLLGAPDASGNVGWRWRVRRLLMRSMARFAAHVIVESREMQALLPASARARSTVLAKGVDTEVFRPLDRAEARSRLGWPLDARIALFAADPEVGIKRFWLAEAAVDRARLELPDLQIRVASGVDPRELPFFMNAADCLLHTSSSEGSPNVVKEALMCNLPVVATPAGDLRELLAGVEPSYLCEPSASVLAEALCKCLRSPTRSNGRSRAGRLDSVAVTRSLRAIYDAILER